ncbi:hypothetical protein D6853_01070 [Butyrivibrio sp. X503]|uniref:O-antigen ligase family protein n=1 Tax=Butyrivibrio sp. X503 TaxID=2364878 RepID=UPI000EA91BE9|nr:hypothetical protein [Butyrivibrio sp. X503]RKM58159.1 hypothetical protein D6853_01070 [Butyrivibrio sp. X503]
MNDLIKKITSNKDKIGEGIYLLYFAVMVGARAAGLYEGMTMYNICLALGLFLFACKIVMAEHTLKEYGVMAAFFALAILVYRFTGEKGLIVCFTMMFGMKGVSVKKTIMSGTVVSGVFILGKIVLGVFGILPEVYYPQDRAAAGLMFRHAFGYAHPNTLHMNVLMLTMMAVYLLTTAVMASSIDRKKKLSCIYLISVAALFFNLYIFMYSGSRTGILACIVFLVCNIWFCIRKNIGIFEKIICYAAFPVTCVVSIILPLVLPEKIFELLNRTVFNSRFMLAKYFWTNNHLSLFGIRLNNPLANYETYGIDMAQMYLFLQLGIVAFIVMAALSLWFINRAIKADKRAELAVMLAMLFLGMWEPLLYNLGFKNFTYLFMGQLMYACLNGDNLKALEVTKDRDGSANIVEPAALFDLRRFTKALTGAVLSGIAASLIFLLATTPPTALYGDRERGEDGVSFGMEAQYLSESEVKELKGNGDIVVGYRGEHAPMYKYSKDIAVMEYDKNVISVGVWIGILAMLVLCAVLRPFTFNKNKV